MPCDLVERYRHSRETCSFVTKARRGLGTVICYKPEDGGSIFLSNTGTSPLVNLGSIPEDHTLSVKCWSYLLYRFLLKLDVM